MSSLLARTEIARLLFYVGDKTNMNMKLILWTATWRYKCQLEKKSKPRSSQTANTYSSKEVRMKGINNQSDEKNFKTPYSNFSKLVTPQICMHQTSLTRVDQVCTCLKLPCRNRKKDKILDNQSIVRNNFYQPAMPREWCEQELECEMTMKRFFTVGFFITWFL